MISYPNQRIVKIHRDRLDDSFLGVLNKNWMAASRDLGAHGLQLYLYLAANADNFNLLLSPTAIKNSLGMAKSTYHDQFHKLVDKHYLVLEKNNTYSFYETPQKQEKEN